MKARWLLLATLPLGGCMTSGTNMHGNFACRAPTGTCAPMSAIDASAIAGMGGSAQPIGGSEIRSIPRGGRVVQASAGSVPARTSDRVLQIVFPAHIDASGIYHDEATAHAVVEPSGWTESMTGRQASLPATTAKNALPAAAQADTGLASLDEVIAAKGAQAVAANRSPVVVPVPAVEGMTPASWSRDPSALSLREAAAGASGGTVPDLDGSNFDTPDVTAAVGPSAGGDASTARASSRFKIVRWHGHKVRVPLKDPAVHATTVATSPPVVRSLNVAVLNHMSNGIVTGAAAIPVNPDSQASDTVAENGVRPSFATPGYATRPIVGSSVASTASVPPPMPATATATAAPPPGVAVAPPLTKSAAVAAARVRAMAAPVIAGGVTSGREQAAAEATPDANPFTALVGAGNGQTAEPRP